MSNSAGSDGAKITKDDDDSTEDLIHDTLPNQSTYYYPAKDSMDHMDSTESITSKKECTKDSVNRNVIRVGTFKINGVKKYFAIVPPILIHSQPDMEDLVSYWGLPGPNFILETNESNEHRESII
jgi:hypothetical protein